MVTVEPALTERRVMRVIRTVSTLGKRSRERKVRELVAAVIERNDHS